MKIGIIGGGISGLGAAYLLSPDHEVTLYEKNAYIGGHSRTIEVPQGKRSVPVDTGFIVFNDWNYPNLMGLFKTIGVPYQKSNMSFGVSIRNGWLEYSSNNLFAQPVNLLRPPHWKMIADILRFNKEAQSYIQKDPSITLGDCLLELRMGDWFCRYYILAMGASIWSCPIETIMKFPARTFLLFFKNHGLLNIRERPQWYTVTGGSREYVKKLTASFSGKVRLWGAATSVKADQGRVIITDANGAQETYDRVIFACHADEALAMLQNPTPDQAEVIGAFTYQTNEIVVHADTSFMPKRKSCWASWVYLSEQERDDNPRVSLSYWMNNLQDLDRNHPVIVTLNPGRQPAPSLTYDRHEFSHPVFDVGAIKAQERIKAIQGRNNIWFCGAYQRYGFHEDGLLSAVNVARDMGASIPWD